MNLPRHRTDLVSLLCGIGFIGGAGLWLAHHLVGLRPLFIAWIVVCAVVLLGLVGLVVTAVTGNRRP